MRWVAVWLWVNVALSVLLTALYCLEIARLSRRRRRAWDQHTADAVALANSGARWGSGPVPAEDRPEWTTL